MWCTVYAECCLIHFVEQNIFSISLDFDINMVHDYAVLINVINEFGQK